MTADTDLDDLPAVLRRPPTPEEAARNRADFTALLDQLDDPAGRRRVQALADEEIARLAEESPRGPVRKAGHTSTHEDKKEPAWLDSFGAWYLRPGMPHWQARHGPRNEHHHPDQCAKASGTHTCQCPANGGCCAKIDAEDLRCAACRRWCDTKETPDA